MCVFVLWSCEDKSGISTKKASVVDFMELYGKPMKDVEIALTNYIVSKNTDENGDPYWSITKKKNEVYTTLNSEEVYISIHFKDNICSKPSLLYRNTNSDYAGLKELQTKYGEGVELERNYYKWELNDVSIITYYGISLGNSTKSLLIDRANASEVE